ncbi:hypothetical protein RUM43_013281 [Polyplax serrata]|uniref:Uncharacterized protein n=1 Tax=Polyplax serrata TaxID=468196 RepID=A0AAN8P547_POLSC
MAAKTATMLSNFDISVKNERLMMNKLRDKGMEYVSSSGKIIAAKTQPAQFCHCPQRCKNKLPQSQWDSLFEQFYDLGDQNKQNQFLQSHILIKAVHLHKWESERSSPANKRRVTCRYHVPDLGRNLKLEDYVKWKGSASIEVCQKAFMNCYGITEKRVRMQRERCISRLAPSHYKNSPFGKRHRNGFDSEHNTTQDDDYDELNDLEITPLDLSNDRARDINGKTEVCTTTHDSFSGNERDEPLDLSNSKQFYTLNQTPIEINKGKLYQVAQKMGVIKEDVSREMTQKYEQLIWKNYEKEQKHLISIWKKKYLSDESFADYNNTEIENRSPKMKAIVEQVVGLGDDLTILPIQTLNNGDLTITPVLGPAIKPVENRDIIQVNTFFQNQLWKPEYIGLSRWRKLKGQPFDV